MRYGVLLRYLHWLMAVVVLGMLGSGLYMVDLQWGDEKQFWYWLHKSVGLVVLVLIVLRIVARSTSNVPKQDNNLAGRAASLGHFGLYIFMLGMPVSGIIMSWSGGYSIPFFSWFSIAGAVEKIPTIATFAHEMHWILGYCFLVLIGLHILGFLYHLLIKKDNRLNRMDLRT